jgi:hypothetical protein
VPGVDGVRGGPPGVLGVARRRSVQADACTIFVLVLELLIVTLRVISESCRKLPNLLSRHS